MMRYVFGFVVCFCLSVVSTANAQTVTVTNSPCAIVVIGKNSHVTSTGCETPPPNLAVLPRKNRQPRKMIIDSEWVFTNPQNSIDFADGVIVFRPGGRIRVHGGRLVIKARSIATEGGARIEIDGTGDPGQGGGTGAAGFGGAGTNCYPSCNGETASGRCVWDTENEDDYVNANSTCDHNEGSCDRGKRGGDGQNGEDGATIEVRLSRKPTSASWTWTAAGGARGPGGAGGLGMRHKHDGKHHDCPSGQGGADGQPGGDGACKLIIGRGKPMACE